MNEKLLLLLLIIGMFVCSCDTIPKDDVWYADNGQTVNIPTPNDLPPGEPGKCYAKMQSTKLPKEGIITLPIYTGSDPAIFNQYVKDTTVVLNEESSDWVKKKSDNCRSTNPEDCLVWCLVKSPLEEKLVKNYLMDRSKTDEYSMKNFVKATISEEGGSVEWVEVLCANEMTPSLINELAEGLRVRGFLASSNGVVDPSNEDFKSALKAFQIKEGMFVGGLSRASVNSLMFK